MKIQLLVFMSEIKVDFTLESQIFCFFYALKSPKIKLFQCVSKHDREIAPYLVVLHQI